MSETSPQPTWRSRILHGLAVALFLVPAGFGFMYKYFDLLTLASYGDEGSFALIPVMNYLLSSLGFFMLFFWAVRHGMFRDVEKVKHTMLANEKLLDELDGR
jgi:hypothetical protein